ncbi:uncharacterized protein LOC129347893 [Amphiprion ocellaris]|uniref:uncharacterized protein LOC129347893 n=1 Tax=Amphiprion ocellaris TaxID=80972 RepID=UPI002411062F|nr:uncharacterized protein LOC129347893 [Amphiprion ocellaris]
MTEPSSESVSSSTSAVDSASTSLQLSQPASSATATAAVKLPDFWQSDPASWFQHIEALFHLRGVDADDSRYYLVVAALDQQSTRRVMSLLRSPPDSGKYAALKQLLVRRYCLSSAERADKLLSLSGLGDCTAVDLMDDMLSLLGSDEGGFLFPHIFLRQLPREVRAALANSPLLAAGDFRGLAEEADRVLLASRRVTVQSATMDPQQMSPTDPAVVSAVSARARRGSPLCFYHRRFGVKARRCVPPCTFDSSGNAVAAVGAGDRGSSP